jgi:hypothetical protein
MLRLKLVAFVPVSTFHVPEIHSLILGAVLPPG